MQFLTIAMAPDQKKEETIAMIDGGFRNTYVSCK
jgi:hypothetical protein